MVHGVRLLHTPSATSTNNRFDCGTISQFCTFSFFVFIFVTIFTFPIVLYKKQKRETEFYT